MKSFEERISRQPPDNFNSNGSQDSYPCGTCMFEVLDEGFSICCDDCDRWFHLKCSNLTIRQLKGMDDNYWNCGCGAVSSRPKAKIFGRYVDDILRSVKVAEIDRLLSYVNTLHPNLAFTIELQLNGTLPFLDMLMCQSVIFGSLTLRKTRTLNFGVKFDFSKIRMEPVMHDFLAITENRKRENQNDRVTIAEKVAR